MEIFKLLLCLLCVVFAVPGLACKDRTPLTVLALSEEMASTPRIDALNQNPITLTGERVTVRTPRRADLPAILSLFHDAKAVYFTWFRKPPGYWTLERTRDQYENFAADQQQGKRQDFVIEHSMTRSFVGRCAIYRGRGEDSWEIGITLVQDYWGKRYGDEVIRVMMKHAFENMGAKDIWFRTEPENVWMLRLYDNDRLDIRKKYDATDKLPNEPFFTDHPTPYHYFLITKDEWKRRS